MRVIKDAGTGMEVNVLSRESLRDHCVEAGFDVLLVAEKISNRCFPAQREIHTVQPARLHAGQGQSRFAQRLTWQRSRVDAGAAQFFLGVHQRDGPAERRRGRRADQPRRPAADHHQVECLRFVRHAFT